MYHILTAEPSVDQLTYPRTPAYPGGTYMYLFEPAWLKQDP